MSFPAAPLNITVELLLNGTWTDITSYVYQRDDITITTGRPNETSQIQPSSMTLTLNNRGGDFSPKNSGGQFYPYIGRNVQIRLSVDDTSSDSTAYSGYRFWGEVSSWPPMWDLTGTDVYVRIEAAGVLRRYVQGSLLGSAFKRFYLNKSATDATYPIALWTCEEGTNSSLFSNAVSTGLDMTWSGSPTLSSDTSFNGADPLPLLNSSIWTGSTGSYSSAGPKTYTTPGTHTFTAPGGVSSLTSVECWGGDGGGGGAGSNAHGGGGGGGGEYAKETSVAVTPGSNYTVTVGAGGSGGTGGNNGGNGGNSSFPGDSVTTTAHGGGGGQQGGTAGTAGTGSTNATHHNGGAGGSSTGRGGGGGGGSAGTSAAGNAGGSTSSTSGGSGATAVTGGGSGGKGGTGSSSTGGTAGSAGGTPPGGGGGGGGSEPSFGFTGGNGSSGKVTLNYTSSTTPNNVVVRFLLSVPSTGAVNAAPLLTANVASGSLTDFQVYYGSGGKLGIKGHNGASIVFDSGLSAFNVDGSPRLVSAELTTSGTSLNWALRTITPGTYLDSFTSGTVTTTTIGAVSSIVVNSAGTVNDTAIGGIVLQYALEDILNSGLPDAINGYSGETAYDRFTRLCTEEGIAYESIGVGDGTDTPRMGPQTDKTLTELLQEIEDADQGLLYETTDQFGLGYRTRLSMMSQSPALTLDYASAHLSEVPQPTYDDQLTRNDITVQRVNGSTVDYQDTTDALSVFPPPDGVGKYSYSLNANLFADGSLPGIASWLLTKGTTDEYRYPGISVDMTRSEVASLFSDVPSLRIGDYLQITNPPSWLPGTTLDQLQYGRTEVLNAFKWVFTFNCVPESPYAGGPAGTNFLATAASGSVDNKSFEGSAGTFTVDLNCTLAQSSAQAYTGTHSLKVTSSASGIIAFTHCNPANYATEALAVTAGDFVMVSMRYFPAVTARTYYSAISWYDSGGTLIKTDYSPAGTLSSDSGWYRSTSTIQAPATAAYAIALGRIDTAAAGSEIHYVDNCFLSLGVY